MSYEDAFLSVQNEKTDKQCHSIFTSLTCNGKGTSLNKPAVINIDNLGHVYLINSMTLIH